MKRKHFDAALCLAMMIALLASCRSSTGQPRAMAEPLAQPMPFEKAFPLAKDIADKFLVGSGGVLWDQMTSEMQKAVGNDRDKWKNVATGIPQQIGHVTQTLNERMLPSLQTQIYTRLIRTDSFPAALVVTVWLMPDSKITALFTQPTGNPAESKFLDYKDKNSYRFPLIGEWTIYQGGRTVYDNYHAAYSDERFAYDIVALRDGSMYKGGGASLDMFYGFGQPVVAAAPGTVVVAEDKYEDNAVGKRSATVPKPGNTVVIDHGKDEFSMYAHLKRGSVEVKAGDTVKAGQEVAEVGNSGNAPIPHLHFHLQNSPVWFQGEGLPVFFHAATVNGKAQVEFEPVRGDVIKVD